MRSMVLALSALAAVPTLGWADEAKVLDLIGKWTGKTHAIVVGAGGHWPSGQGTFENPGRFEKDVVIDIKGQDQRRFWGVTTISGGGEKTEEPFIGAMYKGDNGFMMADTDGFMHGEIDDNEMSFCYGHISGKTPSTVVSCSTVSRVR